MLMALDAKFGEGVVEQLLTEDIQSITTQFQLSFADCVRNVQKPNVLIAGVTGAGKSSLVNAVFGTSVAPVGSGLPVTKHYCRYEPDNKVAISPKKTKHVIYFFLNVFLFDCLWCTSFGLFL